MPYQVFIDLGRGRGHHLSMLAKSRSKSTHTYAVDPLRVEQRLVDVRRAVEPLALHVQVLRSR